MYQSDFFDLMALNPLEGTVAGEFRSFLNDGVNHFHQVDAPKILDRAKEPNEHFQREKKQKDEVAAMFTAVKEVFFETAENFRR